MWVFVVTCELIELYHKYVVHDVSTQLLVDDKDILQIFSMQCQAVIWAVFFILSACKILLAVICRCLIGPLWHFIKTSGDFIPIERCYKCPIVQELVKMDQLAKETSLYTNACRHKKKVYIFSRHYFWQLFRISLHSLSIFSNHK